MKTVEISREQIDGALAEARAAMSPAAYGVLENIAHSYLNLTRLVRDKSASIGRLRKMLFGYKTEKIAREEKAPRGMRPAKKGRSPGHGRNGAADYPEAQRHNVPHEKFSSGDRCPECKRGKLYERSNPGIVVRVTAQPPLTATIWNLQKLRCNLCGEIFEASAPKEAGGEKYDPTCASMIALLKYGSGFPFNRLQRLQTNVGVPLPAATQWKIVGNAAKKMQPAFEELLRQAAQGKVLHNDDTTMKVLTLTGDRARSGVFTSGIVSLIQTRRAQHQVALFMTGHNHAGENLTQVLLRRDAGHARPIQMCDALSRNVPVEFKTILSNCLAHARRQFVDVAENFPRECSHVLKIFSAIYANDELARRRRMSAAQRLRFHQERSAPQMEKLREWMSNQVEEKRVEPNSGLGHAIAYMQRRWKKLTLFLRKLGAPLDNNICERALKRAILHRKNALFFKTTNGARVGDLYMTLIHTCELNHANPLDYLTQLQRHARKVREHPEQWLPWNYRRAVTRARSP